MRYSENFEEKKNVDILLNKMYGIPVVNNLDALEMMLKYNDGLYKRFILQLYNEEKNKDVNYDLLDYIEKNIDEVNSCGVEHINLLMEYERIPKNNFLEICEFNEKVKDKIDVNICVEHTKGVATDIVTWDIDTIIRANTDIDRVCQFIKNSGMSQLETLAFVHEYVSTIAKYHFSDSANMKWYLKDQFFAGAYLKLPEIICAGYATLMKEIIDNLKMPGLECDVVAIRFDKKNKKNCRHARCYVNVKDDKYGINQSCYDDPTWDSPKSNAFIFKTTFTHFAMPNNVYDRANNETCKYREFEIFDLSKKNVISYVTLDPKLDGYNKGKNRLDQKTIEKIFFNMYQKTSTGSFEQLYKKLEIVSKNSYARKIHCGYKNGYLTSRKTILSKEEAKAIFDENINKTLKTSKTDDMAL